LNLSNFSSLLHFHDSEKDFLNVWVYHTGEFWPDFNNFFKNEHPVRDLLLLLLLLLP
jgi:hypothetical protein